jgi:hypothetical protein
LATVFKTIRKSIIFSNVTMYRWECLVVSGEKKEEEMYLKFVHQALVGCGVV